MPASDHLSEVMESLTAALAARYRVERVIGSGGMATVFLAEDLRHRRRVAIKVLRPELAAAVGVERFLAEIRTTATLQHPHILGLIDSGEVNGLPYYVMPFVDGESLRDRLDRERLLPIDDALRYAREIAAALDYAHRHGVIHRDVKPENILLQDGNALVADFGIALAVSTAAGERLTLTGLSIGTPLYMPPEQAMGERSVGARADIYALGAVLYEMLSGEPPFAGPTAQVIIARLTTETPAPLTTRRASIPPGVEAAVFKALEKIPADRYGSANELADALTAPARPGRFTAPATRPQRRIAMFLAFAASIAAAAGLGWWFRGRTESQRAIASPPSRLALPTAPLAGGGEISLQRQLAITPDGGTLLYVARGADGASRLVRQSLSDAEPTPISDVRPGLAAPVISADGRAFFGLASGERQAYRHPIAGGLGESLPLAGGYTDFAQWDDRGVVWYTPSNGGGLRRLAPGDSTSHAIEHSEALRLQQVLPDGRYALVMGNATTLSGPASIFDMQTGEKTPLIADAIVEVRYGAGYLVYVLPNGVLEAAPFDIATHRITGPAAVIGSNVAVTGSGVAQFAVARSGTVAYIVEEPPSLVFVDRSGTVRPAIEERHAFHGPRFSPDGRHIAMDFTSESGRDVWILSVENGTLSRATFAGDGHDVTWMPDGRSITFLSTRSGRAQIFRKGWSGSDPPEPLFASAQLGFTGLWLPDGSGLVTVMNDLRPHSAADIAVIRNGGRGPAEPLVATEFTESYPAVSPDGHWLAFVSDQSGHLEVYVRPIGAEGEQVQVSRNGGTEPAWMPDGHEIVYRSVGDRSPTLIAATVRAERPFAITARRSLFSTTEMLGAQPHASYDIAPDGHTFVMVQRGPTTRILVLQNLAALSNVAKR